MDKKNIYNWLKIIVLILSVYFAWKIIIGDDYRHTRRFAPIPFTIITIYVWRRFINKNI